LAIRVEWRDDEFPAAIKTSVANVDARIIEQLELLKLLLPAARFYDVAAPARGKTGPSIIFSFFGHGSFQLTSKLQSGDANGMTSALMISVNFQDPLSTWKIGRSMKMASAVTLWVALAAAARPTHHANVFAAGDKLELRVFLSPSRAPFTDFNNTDALLWSDKSLVYSEAGSSLEKTVHVPLTERLLSNGTMFAHMFITKAGASPDPQHGSYDRLATTSNSFDLVGFSKRLQPRGLYNLLTGEPAPWETELRRGLAEAEAAGRSGEFVSFWKPKLHLQLLVDTESYELDKMPPLLHSYLHHHRLMSGHRFRPLIYVNELTTMKSHWVAINASKPLPGGGLPLTISYSPLPTRRFQWMVNLQHSFKMNEETLGISEKESEDLRGMFVHTNPLLLYTTVAVSAVHLLFDVLAFKNDVSFWSSVDSMEGLSSRTLLLNQGMEFIILLYLFEEVTASDCLGLPRTALGSPWAAHRSALGLSNKEYHRVA
jgi:hypothetical protein